MLVNPDDVLALVEAVEAALVNHKRSPWPDVCCSFCEALAPFRGQG